MREDLQELLFSEEQIQTRVKQMAKQVARDYQEKNPVVVCVLKGAVLFMADLIRYMEIPLETDFIAISSYGASTKSSGVVRILKDLDRPIEDRDVLIVEDIVDSGLTLSYLRDSLLRRNARSVKIAAAFDKPDGRTVDITPDYSGFTVPNRFIVGYGLDYAERYRNLPYVGVLKPSVYEKEKC
ncbi:hypoxanthine phosphoribosyltransferase [Sulfoacidibacillus thermotolerans]|uniref:Hypoxanthine phosphoribosyltransferase n=1 Tax=Sulfoacidibacillus thermotolerans TaxID=1765684 RepID=A0A2U3DB26_SULT2|nr:hypoxanthine phosphoribosyltransferase [Sulfoacidibacillus thermotolerans]PWI58462.1 hypoxanthine phosphoribosyltransferase [Sulfoacidibacillus thermotolerans]